MPLMFWNDDCTMTTTGHSTTRPMRAMAGPSHSSGESRRRAGIEFILRWLGDAWGPGAPGPHAESDSERYLGCQLAEEVAVCSSWLSTVVGLPVTAVPIVC